MSSEIMIRDAAAPSDPDSDLLLRWENTINTPIISASYPANGKAVAGVYTIVGASSSTIDITSDDPKNELVGTGVTVVANGTTPNDLGFASIVFSGSLAVGWTAKVSVGALMATDGSTSRRFDVGIIEAGTTSTQRKVTAVNVGTETSSETKVYALPGFFVEGAGVEDYIEFIRNHTDPARHDLAIAGDYDITFDDYQAGPPQTHDVWINDGGGAVKCIEDAKFDGTLYEYGVSGYIDAADELRGLGIAFMVDPGDASSKTFTLHVRESYSWIEFAPDVAGSPGTWSSGPLTLTESGEVSGVITPSGQVHFWVRSVVPASANPGDMRLHTYRVRGLTV
jgi:hypothetical protein